ncbi:MAG: NUDIX domain-containing protein [Lentisphaerales bacterium]|nr:NUDIX domain-containing protein [Lentisphaerales bacterium]
MKDIYAAVTIITFEKKEVLILKRAINPLDPWSGHLSLPGGRIEETDNSPHEAAIRETEEECGITLTKSDFIQELPVEKAGMAIGKAVNVIPYHYDLTVKPEIKLQLEEHQGFSWVEIDYLTNKANHLQRHLSKDYPEMLFPCIDIKGTPLWGFTYKVLEDFFCWNK